MELDPHWYGRRPSGPRIPAAEPPGSAGSTCACHSNGLPKPSVFFRPPGCRNIGVADLAAASASLIRRHVGQCGRVSPVSEHKDSFDIHKRIYFSGTLVANWAALGST